eukprot:scaffold287_cov337-Pavlova_lutheri.AAC.245
MRTSARWRDFVLVGWGSIHETYRWHESTKESQVVEWLPRCATHFTHYLGYGIARQFSSRMESTKRKQLGTLCMKAEPMDNTSRAVFANACRMAGVVI